MTRREKKRLETRFPPSLFAIYLGILLLMSGIHTGLVTLVNEYQWNSLIQIAIPVVYWTLVSAGLTIFTRHKIIKTYDRPMKELARAADQVAKGDFSVYIPPLHTSNHHDYLDLMFLDFNKMVAELGSIETLKTDFFSNVSHEIKTPLAVIQNHAELLQQKQLTEEQRQESTAVILQAARRLSSLITNMLKLNKLEKQVIQPQPRPFDVCAQLCACALQFEDVWEKKQIDFEADLQDRLLLTADEGLLELVWTNLLSNAMKFTPAGGKVTLTQRTDGECVIVTVADTGCGMDPATRRHIFDQFYQGDTSHATEGNGLGLALVRRVLELSDGTITVASTPGQGSTFTVELPLTPRQEENPA